MVKPILISITILASLLLLISVEIKCHQIAVASRVKRQDPGIGAVFSVGADIALSAIDTVQNGFAARGTSRTKLGIRTKNINCLSLSK